MQTVKKQPDKKIQYPIAFKLVSIITMLLLVSLGVIIFLASYFVTADVQVTAEENNFSANQRSASEVETRFASVRSAAMVLLDTLEVAGEEGAAALTGQDAEFFFSRNQDIIAILVPGIDGGGRELINARYFASTGLDRGLPAQFLAGETAAPGAGADSGTLERCRRGETVILNAAPAFHVPVLAIFCPWQNGASQSAAGPAALPAVIFFTFDSLADDFGQGASVSFLINDMGDLLVHSDYEMVRAGVNMANDPFVQRMRTGTENNLQTLYTSRDGVRYFGAFQKLTTGGAAVITNIEYSRVFEGTMQTIRRNLYLSGAVLFASIILIRLFSKSISRPLEDLAAAAEKIEGGDFALALEPKTRDEVGALTSSFAKMSGALGVFGRFANRDIAVRAMRGEIRPGGEAKNATIFFSDIRNFTLISETFSKHFGGAASDKIIQWLNEYFTRMVECVEKTNGVVDKFIGDALMAHWGTAYTGGSQEKDAFNCVTAALMMRNALMKLNAERRNVGGFNSFIKIGCGINSGLVTAGQLGSVNRMEYTVVGDPVNLANRVESINKVLGTDILITESTWKLIGDYLITEEMPSVTVKGQEQPVRLFAVVNTKMKPGKEQPAPRTLAEVRALLGITPPDMDKVDVNAEETKYQFSGK